MPKNWKHWLTKAKKKHTQNTNVDKSNDFSMNVYKFSDRKKNDANNSKNYTNY